MRDLQEIDELRPAPRTTPTVVLWLMLSVVLGGAAVLAWTPPAALVGPMASANAAAASAGVRKEAPRAAASVAPRDPAGDRSSR